MSYYYDDEYDYYDDEYDYYDDSDQRRSDDSSSTDDEYRDTGPPPDEELNDMLRPYSYPQQRLLESLLKACDKDHDDDDHDGNRNRKRSRREGDMDIDDELISKCKDIVGPPKPTRIFELALTNAISYEKPVGVVGKLIEQFSIDLSKPITEMKEDSSNCDVFSPYPAISYVRTPVLFIILKYNLNKEARLRDLLSRVMAANMKPDLTAVDETGITIFQELIWYYQRKYLKETATLEMFLRLEGMSRKGIWPGVLNLDKSIVAILTKDSRAMAEIRCEYLSSSSVDCMGLNNDESCAELIGHEDFPVSDESGNSPLVHHLVERLMAASLEALLKRDDVNINTKNDSQETALDVAREIEFSARRDSSEIKRCTKLLEENGAEAKEIPELKFRDRKGDIVSIRKDLCLEASDYFRAMHTTQIGTGPPDEVVMEEASAKSMEFIKNIVEGREWKVQVYQWRKTFIMPIIHLANQYLFAPVQIFIAEVNSSQPSQ